MDTLLGQSYRTRYSKFPLQLGVKGFCKVGLPLPSTQRARVVH
jgi:hypothetical protein